VKLELIHVQESDKAILKNLLELYDNEPNDYEEYDPNEEQLPYEYKYLEHYFREKDWRAYFIMANGDYAGFLMINPVPEVSDIPTDYSLSEFYVKPNYRRCGVGRFAVNKIFDMYKGKWQLTRDPRDKNSVPFWNKVIDEYTNGNFEVKESYPQLNFTYSGGVLGDVFFFES
jgi:predicted acetyltransferase